MPPQTRRTDPRRRPLPLPVRDRAASVVSARRRGPGRVLLALLLVLPLCVLGAAAPGPAMTDLEQQVKAAFLFNFVRYTEWPDEAFAGEDDPIVVAIVGDDPFGEALDEAMQDKLLHDRRLEVHRFAKAVELTGPCHLVYVSTSESRHLDDLFDVLDERPTFSVSDIDDFTRQGGTAKFFLQEGKIRFEINTDAARRSGLHISSQLLKLAVITEND